MKFSVLMSVYINDNPDHFKFALESVSVQQTVKPDQIVIVQDGIVSREIDEIINDLSNRNDIEFTVIKKNINSGLADSLNLGLAACKYEYVARMDADDISVERRFELQTSIMDFDSSLDILGGFIIEFEENDKITSSIREVGLTNEDIIKMSKHRCPFNHMTVMYKKNKVLEVGGYDVSYGKLEDYKLWVDMMSKGCKCRNLSDILVKVRVGNGMLQRRSNPREIQDWDKLQILLRDSGIINRLELIQNRLYIRIFTYCPVWIKKYVYKIMLRK